MTQKRNKMSDIVRLVAGDAHSVQKWPLLNTAVAVYVGVVLMTYMLFLIAPFITVLAKTPLYSIKTYLGLIGAGLLALDLVTNRGLWRGKGCLLLYGICASAAISTLTTISYGIKDNLFDLCWLVVQFALVYSCAWRMDRKQLKKLVDVLFFAMMAVWLVACAVSVVQYLYRIGYTYIANPLSDNPELSRQGFWDNRLFGVFTGIDYAVYMSLILIIGSVYYLFRIPGKPVRIGLGCAIAVLFLHIVLSGSRSVQVAMVIYTFCLALLLVRRRDPGHRVKQYLVRLAAAGCAMLLVIGCYNGTKSLMERVPDLSLMERPGQSGEVMGPTDPDAVTDPTEPPQTSLDRELEDVSNDRFQIWGDYLSMAGEIGPFGLSLSNYNDYISANHPELYIVKHFTKDYGDSVKTDIVYECHNNYLFVFVSTGIVGLACFAAFLILALVRVLKYMKMNPRMSDACIALSAIVGVGCVEALFMNSVFLKINAMSFIFWFALGILMNLIPDRAGENS